MRPVLSIKAANTAIGALFGAEITFSRPQPDVSVGANRNGIDFLQFKAGGVLVMGPGRTVPYRRPAQAAYPKLSSLVNSNGVYAADWWCFEFDPTLTIKAINSPLRGSGPDRLIRADGQGGDPMADRSVCQVWPSKMAIPFPVPAQT